jgi:hypothetical protein
MRHAATYALALLSALTCTSCARVTALEGPPQDLQTLYQDAVGTPPPAPALQPKALPVGPEVPYTPIMHPPKLQRVWVPDHLNADGDLVAGHWVYLLLEPSRWFLETYPPAPMPTLRVPLAPPAAPASPGAPEVSAPLPTPVSPPMVTPRTPQGTTLPPAPGKTPRRAKETP